MLSQLRAAFVPLSQPTATAPATGILPNSQPPQQPHPTSTYHRFARHTRPAAADHPSPTQQPILPLTSPQNHSDDTTATQQQPSTISSPTTVTTNGSVNSWTSVNKDSYSPLNSSAMAGGAAGWTDAEKVRHDSLEVRRGQILRLDLLLRVRGEDKKNSCIVRFAWGVAARSGGISLTRISILDPTPSRNPQRLRSSAELAQHQDPARYVAVSHTVHSVTIAP